MSVRVPGHGGVTLTEWCDEPGDGAWHPNITRFTCAMPTELPEAEERTHAIRRAAWLVEFEDARVEPMFVCYGCARSLFGVVKP